MVAHGRAGAVGVAARHRIVDGIVFRANLSEPVDAIMLRQIARQFHSKTNVIGEVEKARTEIWIVRRTNQCHVKLVIRRDVEAIAGHGIVELFQGGPMDLENKSVIITGASSGIGASAAALFAANGANVVLGARRSAEFEAIASTINGGNGRAVSWPATLRSKDMPKLLSASPRKNSAVWTILSTMPASWGK